MASTNSTPNSETAESCRDRHTPSPQHHAWHTPHPPNPARSAPGANHMNTNTTAVSAMIDGRRSDSTRRRQRVLNVIDAAIAAGDELSATNIAHRAGVDRTFLYRHRDLLERIHAAETRPLRTPAWARSHPRLPASRPARCPATLRPHGRPHPVTRNTPVRTARRTSLARNWTRCTYRHRPTPVTHRHARTTGRRPAVAT